MATLNATTSSDILIPTNNGVTYRGLAGDDTYILSNAITANSKVSIVDTSGSNKIQLVDGLTIASSKFAADAVQLTLSNGAVVTVNGADKFSFDVGGNATSGTIGAVSTFTDFASAMGVATLPTGTTLADGTSDVSIAGTSVGASGANVSYTITTDITTVGEGGSATITVTPSAAPSASQTVTVSVSGSDNGGALTAASIGDYEVSTGSLTFAAGSSAAQTFTVTASSDVTAEPLEGLKVSLLDDSLNVLGTKILGISDNSATAAQTFTLSSTSNTVTGGVDNITGAGGDDTFNATISGALSSADIIDGGAGTDVLNARYSVAAASTQTATVSNVEIVYVDTDDGLANTSHTTTFDLATFTGVQQAWAYNNDSGDATAPDTLTISNIPLGTTVGVKGGDANSNNTFTYLLTTALTDTATLALDTAKSNNITIAGIEALTISASGKSTIDALTTTSAVNLVVNASGKTTLTDIDNVTRTVDASGSTGDVTIAGIGTYSKGTSVTGGSGNDTLNMGAALNSLDTFDGGSGIDTLLVSGSANTAGMGAGISNVEVFGSSTANADVTIRMDTVSDVSSFYVVNADANDNGTAFTTTLSKSENGDVINIYAGSSESDATNDGTKVTVTAAVDSTSDDITFVLAGIGAAAKTVGNDAYATASGIQLVTASSHETVNITSNANATNAAITKNAIEGLVTTVGKAVTIDGTTNLRVTMDSSPTTLLSIDASALDAKLELFGVDASGSVLGQNTIKMAMKDTTVDMAGLNTYDTIVGGAGTADYLLATAITGLTTASGALNISDVETVALRITGANTNISVANVTGMNTLEVGHVANSATTSKISGIDPTTTIQLGVNNSDTDGTDEVFDGTATLQLVLADETGADDTLNLAVFSAAATTSAVIKTTAIENINVAVSSVKAGDAIVNLAAALANTVTLSGGDGAAVDDLSIGSLYKTVSSLNSTFAGNIVADMSAYSSPDGITGVTASALGMYDATFSLITSAYNDTVTIGKSATTAGPTVSGGAGTADVLNLTVAAGFKDLDDITGFETINLAVNAGDSITVGANADELDGIVGAKSLVVTGGNAVSVLTLGGANDKLDGTTLNNIDASGFGGYITLVFDTDDWTNALRAQAVIGGSTAFDSITGAYDAANTASAAYKINTTAVETIVTTFDIGNNGAEAYFFDVLKSDASSIQLNSSTTGNTTVTVANIATNDGSQTFQLGGTAADGFANASTAIFTLTSTIGTNTALTVSLRDTDTAGGVTQIDAAGVETLNLKLYANAENHAVDLAGVTPTAGSVGSVIVTGGATGALTVSNMNASQTTLDASASNSAITLAAASRTDSAMTITGSLVNDSIAMENVSDAIDASSGTGDTLVVSYTGIIGGIVIDLSADDQVTNMDGASNAAVQANFENVNVTAYTNFGASVTGTAKANTITGTPLNDTITGGNGADTIIGNGGDDIVRLAETISAADTVTLAVGSSDTATISGFTMGVDIIDGDASAATGNGTPANTIKQAAALSNGDAVGEISTNALVVFAVDDTSTTAVLNALKATDFDTTAVTRWFLYDTGSQLVLAKGSNADTDDDNDVTLVEFATFTDITDITATTLTVAGTIDLV
jgi:hypothetical protein